MIAKDESLSGGVESRHAGHTQAAGRMLKSTNRVREPGKPELGRQPSGSSAPPAQPAGAALTEIVERAAKELERQVVSRSGSFTTNLLEGYRCIITRACEQWGQIVADELHAEWTKNTNSGSFDNGKL
jgi:hypothetical protein